MTLFCNVNHAQWVYTERITITIFNLKCVVYVGVRVELVLCNPQGDFSSL